MDWSALCTLGSSRPLRMAAWASIAFQESLLLFSSEGARTAPSLTIELAPSSVCRDLNKACSPVVACGAAGGADVDSAVAV